MQQQMAAMQQLVRANPMMAMAASQMAGAAAAGNPMANMMQQVSSSMETAEGFRFLVEEDFSFMRILYGSHFRCGTR